MGVPAIMPAATRLVIHACRSACTAGSYGKPGAVAITGEHLRQLFDSDLPDPQLVLLAGAVEVVAGPADEADGLVVASRADLLAQHGGSAPTSDVLDQLAQHLDSAVTEMGG
jgi:hypothetical protein